MIKELYEEFSKIEKSFYNNMSEAFDKECEQLFKEYPQLLSFSWTQYTPYFNDGDSCTFSVYPYFDQEDDIEFKTIQPDSVRLEIVSALENIIGYMPLSLMQNKFGDHVQIRIYKNRTEINDYDHD